LYGQSWTSTLGLRSRNGRGGRLKEFIPLDSRDLGSRGVEAFKTLGFSWADALVASVDRLVEMEPRKIDLPISSYESKLMEAFDNLIVFACSSDTPENFATCEQLDDILNV
jgi:hypothetical protein